VNRLRATLLAASLAATSCAGTNAAQTALDELSRALYALNAAYHAECDGREHTKVCVDALEAYNSALGAVGLVNPK
jgi:hypothetical protein